MPKRRFVRFLLSLLERLNTYFRSRRNKPEKD